MTKRILASLFLGGAAVVSSPALAQSSTAETTASTTIVRPVAIAKTGDLAFGTIIRPADGSSTVSVGTDSDTVTASGAGFAILGGTSRAKYSITGEGGQAVSIDLPESFSMARAGGGSLLVSLESDLGASTNLSGSAGSDGTKLLNVGGSFDVTDATQTGAYTGTFNVTVAYQ